MTRNGHLRVLLFLWLAAAGTKLAGAGPSFYDLGNNLGGTESMAFAVSDSGVVTGYATTTAGALGTVATQGFTYTPSGGISGGGALAATANARGINDSGGVVGMIANSANGMFDACLCSGGSLIDLGGSNSSEGNGMAYCVNDANVVGGTVASSSHSSNAAIWFNPLTSPATFVNLRPVLTSVFNASSAGEAVVGMNANYAFIQYQQGGSSAGACIYSLNTQTLVTAAVPGLGGNSTFAGSAGGSAIMQGGGGGISTNFDASGHGWVCRREQLPRPRQQHPRLCRQLQRHDVDHDRPRRPRSGPRHV